MPGVKIVFLNDEGLVLAVNCGKDGWSLPSAQIRPGEDPAEAAGVLFEAVTGRKRADLKEVFRGPDDEHGESTTFRSSWTGEPSCEASWVDPREVLCGKWGLHAIEAFNRAGIVRRPRLRVEDLYGISKKALSRGSEESLRAVDMVMDEIALLMDIGKPWAVDSLLRGLDVTRLHADVISAVQAAIEDIPELPARESFNLAASRQIAQVDGLRTKIRFGSLEDVRAAALKIYRQRGKEFGQALRDGTLSKRFPYMKHIAEAEARLKGGEAAEEGRTPARTPPLAEWPEAYRIPVAERTDIVEEVDPYKPGERGVCLERPGPRRSTWFETTPEGRYRVEQVGDEITRTKEDGEESDFVKELRAALDDGLKKLRAPIELEPTDPLSRELSRWRGG